MYNNPYQTENWKALEEARKQRDDIDNAIFGWFIGVFGFFFIIGIIYLLLR